MINEPGKGQTSCITQHANGTPYRLNSPFDFSFLGRYGQVFKVFDNQDSGNICFGIADGQNKYFVKFAGAPTIRSATTPAEAIQRMKSTAQIYQDLAHPNLTRLLDAYEVAGGYATVFEWTNAICMGRQYPETCMRFMQMSNETKLKVFDDILDFHIHVAARGYVAIDFYDGCIMYDFENEETVICDIEFYAKTPYTNNMGRMWGSRRFMSPEEFRLGAAIDEVTNVYTMGATAFELFGDNLDRCIEKWTLNERLFHVAKKAVCDERAGRQQRVTQFAVEWRGT